MDSKVTASEWRFAIIAAVIVITATFLPVIYGVVNTPDRWQFTGVNHLNAEDTYSYLSWIEQGRQWHLLFQNVFDSGQQQRLIVQPLFLVMGFSGALTGLPNLIIYHVFRVVLGFIFLVIVYKFGTLFFYNVRERKIFYLLVLGSSGIGWLVGSLVPSTDLWVTDSISFLALYQSPLLLYSLSLMIAVWYGVIRFLQVQRWKYALGGGAAFFILIISHYYICLLLGLGIMLFALFERARERCSTRQLVQLLGCLGIGTVLGGWYLLYASHRSSGLFGYFSQMDFYSPAPIAYLAGFGFIVLLAIFGAILAIRQHRQSFIPIIIWVFFAIFLLYQPWLPGLQRKFTEGLQIALVLLATSGVAYLLGLLERRGMVIKKSWFVYGLLFLSLSNVSVMLHDVAAYRISRQVPFYMPIETVYVASWLKQNTQPSEIILAPYWTSNFIAGLAARTVYMGHAYNTPDSRAKWEQVNWFFNTSGDLIAKKNFLEHENIQFIVSDSSARNWLERDMGSQKVFQQGETTLYRVRK